MYKPGLNKRPDWKKVALFAIIAALLIAAVRLHALPMDDMSGASVVWLLLAFLYFIPSIIAYRRKNRTALFVTNLLFGWTLIGWGIALIWAVKEET